MDEVQKFRMWRWMPFTNEAVPAVFVLYEAYAKLLQALSDSATNTLTICGLRDMAVKRAEKAEAERDALAGEMGKAHDMLARAKAIMESDARRIASLEAQLSACTKAHYGQMAEEAAKPRPYPAEHDRRKVCMVQGHTLDMTTRRCRACSWRKGERERKQTQGL